MELCLKMLIGVVYQDKCLYLQQIYPGSVQTLQAFLDSSLDDSPGRVYALENAPLGGTHDPLWWNKWLLELTLGAVDDLSKGQKS